jgi:ABC-type uncharacterized transport system fused permease/ATPase subunit
MAERRVNITRATLSRLLRAVIDFANCEVRWRARGLFALLIVFLFAFNGLNVLNSYVGRDFMTAISTRDSAEFTRLAVVYLGVFAASALVGAFSSFSEQRLDLLWRQWLTGRLLAAYLEGRSYYELSAAGVLTSPDERIAEDVRTFTSTTVSFVLLLSNATVTVVAFSGVLWSISHALFLIAILYAACGSALTVLFGRPLVWLNYNQLDKEADFRANLIYVQENAESIALLHREAAIGQRLRRRFDDLVANMRRTISVNRNLAFFTNGYNYLIQIIPALLFLPERPYLSPGTLRQVLGTGQEMISDEDIRGLLHPLGLDAVLEGTAGLDVERDWDDALSLSEQHLLSVARVVLAAPHFVFLDRLRSALEPARFEGVLKLFSTRSITYLTIGNGGDSLDDYDVVLEIGNDGSWTRRSVDAGSERAVNTARIAT